MDNLIGGLAKLGASGGDISVKRGIAYLEDGTAVKVTLLMDQAVAARAFLKESARIIPLLCDMDTAQLGQAAAQADRLVGYINKLMPELCQHTYHHLISDGECCTLCGEARVDLNG